MAMESPAKEIVSQPERLQQTAADLRAYRASLEDWAEEQLKPYIERIQALPSLRDKAGKEINDAVWRTISLSPFEVLILDSPLVQRLRRVRQLGVVHWIYPSAGHSRLEHSLGAVHQVQRLLDSLNRDAGDRNTLTVEWVNLLRLTALVHDIGHGLMSHVVENSFDSFGMTDDLLLEIADQLEVEDCSLSEAAAYFILGSDIFKELVEVACGKTAHRLPDGWQDRLCKAILGKPIHKRWPLLQELISGPFDGDKLDYMSRDAQSAGIPNLTDIPRLIQKVRVAEVTAADLPPEIGRTVAAGEPSYFVQGILLSGGRTLDELMIARTLLFDKIYRHQKTRAVEAMVANAIRSLLPLLEQDSLLTMPLKIGDDEFVALTKETIASRLAVRPECRESVEIGGVADIIARIRDRNLFVRAYAFSHTMPHDPFRDEPRQKAGLEQLRRAFASNPQERASLLDAIVATAEEIVRHAAELLPVKSSDLPLKAYIALDPFGKPTKMNEIARAYLVTTDRKLVRFREDSAESPAWSNAYLMTRDTGYVFAAPEYAPAVFLACEAVFRQRYGVRTPPSAIEYSKVEKRAVEAIRVRLAERGFYAGKPSDLCPVPQRLKMADVAGILRSVAAKLKVFQPYADAAGTADGGTVDDHKIEAWLRQFETDDRIGHALSMLQAVKVLSREEVRQAVEGFLTANPDFRGCHVCQLGGPRDSSSIITYFAQDLADRWDLNVVPLQQALSEDERPILFVDDFLGTGRQSVSIVKHWINEPYGEQLDEDHGPKLTPKQADELKGRRLGFAFVYGTTEGKDRLVSELRTSGIEPSVHVGQDEAMLPKAFGGAALYPSPEAAERFQTWCRDVGQKLLASRHAGDWDVDKINGRALGYGNNAYLVVFPYNVPTASLTLLWSEGNVKGIDWMPLLPRRKKT